MVVQILEEKINYKWDKRVKNSACPPRLHPYISFLDSSTKFCFFFIELYMINYDKLYYAAHKNAENVCFF